MKPFLRWAGGKRWLTPRIHTKLPAYGTYFEPFVGSGAVLFSLEPRRGVISDSNPELINCYLGVRNHCQAVVDELNHLRFSKDEYYRIRDELYPKADAIRRAAYFIYLNRTCWNGLYRVNQKGQFNVPMGTLKEGSFICDADHLSAAQQILQRCEVLCCDFEESASLAMAGDLVYFDPPYIKTHRTTAFIGYTSTVFNISDELRLASLAARLASGGVHVMVSNSSHPVIRQQYDGIFHKQEIGRASSIAGDSSRRTRFAELFASSFGIIL